MGGNNETASAVPPGRLLLGALHRRLASSLVLDRASTSLATLSASSASTAAAGSHPAVVGGQVGVATLLLICVSIGAWLGWCHPLLDAAISHGAGERAGWCGLLALATHVLLCGLAALGPPGCGLAGAMVAISAARAGYRLLALCSFVEAVAAGLITLAGLEVYKRTLRSPLLHLETLSPHAAPRMPPSGQAAPPTPAMRVAYGRI